MKHGVKFSRLFYLILGLIQFSIILGGPSPVYAKKINLVRLYTHNDIREMEALVPLAEKATGLKIEFVRLSSSQILARLQAESPRFGADMVWGVLNSDAIEAKKKGFLFVDEFRKWENISEKFKDPEGYWCGWSYWYNTLLVNPGLLKKKGIPLPASWADLINPCYRGEVVASNPGTSGTAFLAISSLIQAMGWEKGWDYLKKLDKNIAQYTKSGSAPAHMVAMGEYCVGITWDRAAQLKKKAGFPVQEIVPAEGTGFDLDSIMVLKGSKYISNAIRLSNWILSEKGQKACSLVRSRVVNSLVAAHLGQGPVLFSYDAEKAALSKAELLETWKEYFR